MLLWEKENPKPSPSTPIEPKNSREKLPFLYSKYPKIAIFPRLDHNPSIRFQGSWRQIMTPLPPFRGGFLLGGRRSSRPAPIFQESAQAKASELVSLPFCGSLFCEKISLWPGSPAKGRDFNQVIYLTLEHLFEPEVEFKII